MRTRIRQNLLSRLAVLTALLAAAIFARCTNEGDDTTAPSDVLDLEATGASACSAVLTWTATGDDGADGTASSYDVRYSTTEIIADNWADATQCGGEPAPGPSGSEEHFTVSGLTPHTRYFFRLVAVDENGNGSGPSNQAETQTLTASDSPAVAWVRDGLAREDQDWTCFPHQLSAAWAAVRGATGYQYAVGTAAGASDVADWQFPAGTLDTLVTRTGLDLVAGETYFFAVRALMEGGCSGYTSSDGTTLDVTHPVSSIRAPGIVACDTLIELTWGGSDDLSGISDYDVEWRDFNMFDPWLKLMYGTRDTSIIFIGKRGHLYYFRSRARDRAGNVEDYPFAADAHVRVTEEIPPVPWVNDGPAEDQDWTNSGSQLAAGWGSLDGVGEYDYRIDTGAETPAIVDWTSAGDATQISSSGLSLVEGERYFTRVRAIKDGCPGPSCSSDGILVDLTPPTSSMESMPETTYATRDAYPNIPVAWNGEDRFSPHLHFDVQARAGEMGPWIDWKSNVDAGSAQYMAEGESAYYFRCRAMDLAGNVEPYREVADAHTYLKAAPPPPPAPNSNYKMALHLVTHAVSTCKALPAIQDVNSLNRIWSLTGPGSDLDAFFVIFDFDSVSSIDFGLLWPGDWGTGIFTACPPATVTGGIVDPGDGVRLSYDGCQVSARLGGSAPQYWTTCYAWLLPASDGQICMTSNPLTGDFGVADCRDPQFRRHEAPVWVFCAGVNVIPFDGPPCACEALRNAVQQAGE